MEGLPIAIVDVAGEEDEVDALGDRHVDQSFQRSASRGAQPRDGRALVAVETAQRAVDVEIGGVDESH